MSNSIYAELAQLSYLQKKQPETYKGFTRDQSYSPVNSTVWRKDDSKDIILSIKGTSNFGDVKLDALITVGLLPLANRLKAIKKRFKELAKDPQSKIFITSHSLGGSIALQLLKDNSILERVEEVYAFNMGSAEGISGISENIACKLGIKKRRCKLLKQKLHIIHSYLDPISFLSRFEVGKHTTTGLTHSMSNFTQKADTKPVVKHVDTVLHELEPPPEPVEQQQTVETEEKIEPIEDDTTGGRVQFYTRRHQRGINDHYTREERLKNEHLRHIQRSIV